MGIINVKQLVERLDDKNHYTYMRVRNMLSGLKGKSTKKEIQQVRKLIKSELTLVDNILSKLENE